LAALVTRGALALYSRAIIAKGSSNFYQKQTSKNPVPTERARASMNEMP